MHCIIELTAERRELIEFFGDDSRFVSDADDERKMNRQEVIEDEIQAIPLDRPAVLLEAFRAYIEPDGDHVESA